MPEVSPGMPGAQMRDEPSGLMSLAAWLLSVHLK